MMYPKRRFFWYIFQVFEVNFDFFVDSIVCYCCNFDFFGLYHVVFFRGILSFLYISYPSVAVFLSIIYCIFEVFCDFFVGTVAHF